MKVKGEVVDSVQSSVGQVGDDIIEGKISGVE